MMKANCGGLKLDGITIQINGNGELVARGLVAPSAIPIANSEGVVVGKLTIDADGNMHASTNDVTAPIILSGLAEPTADDHAATKKYVDAAIAAIGV